ncbi:MAG: arginine deiminase family protein [Clostridiales bacterium]|nr:arginine deiminase family protein [Clostridiales bacterium]
MVRNEGERLRRVIVSLPRIEYFRVGDPEAHNIEQVADRAKAIEQHRRLCGLMRQRGARVINLGELAGHPNSVFARDSSLVTPEGYIKLRMGLKTRRGEEHWVAAALDALGVPCAGEIRPPGTVEGGDVILAGEVAFVGQSERTNASGVKQVSRLLESMGYEVRVIILAPPYLHIGGAMSLIGPKAVLCCRGIFPRSFFSGFETLSISSGRLASCNVICLGNNEVIVEKKNTVVAKALREVGYKVHTLDLSEFVKGRGGPTCLILPVDRG